METRILMLAVPSALVLVLLVAHSFRTLPRRRALVFWGAVTAFGLVRGWAVGWITEEVLGASFPYVIHDPVAPVAGVSLQEVAGWAIVAYLAWWLGSQFSSRLMAQVAWGSLFLGAVSWAVEAAAVAAGWWHWRVPVRHPILLNVPFIGLVDWLFVGLDFLLPFLALTAPALRDRPVRWLSLAVFPLHFGAHAFLEPLSPMLPIPVVHLVHWGFVAVLVALALRSRIRDRSFAEDRDLRRLGIPVGSWPLLGLAVVLAVVVAVDLFLAERPELLVSVLPVFALTLQTLWPTAGFVVGTVALLAALAWLPLALAAVPAGVAALLEWGKRHPVWVPATAVLALAVVSYQVHSRAAERHEQLTGTLDRALAERDRGWLGVAAARLEKAVEEFPGSHAPAMLLGEIRYHTGRLADARRLFEHVVAIRQDLVRAYRFLAVIDLRLGHRARALSAARRGLEVARDDPELRYLALRAAGKDVAELLPFYERVGPEEARSLPALAVEVDDLAGAAALLDRALERWPAERWPYPARVRVALAAGDRETARRVLHRWRERFPDDPEARRGLL